MQKTVLNSKKKIGKAYRRQKKQKRLRKVHRKLLKKQRRR